MHSQERTCKPKCWTLTCQVDAPWFIFRYGKGDLRGVQWEVGYPCIAVYKRDRVSTWLLQHQGLTWGVDNRVVGCSKLTRPCISHDREKKLMMVQCTSHEQRLTSMSPAAANLSRTKWAVMHTVHLIFIRLLRHHALDASELRAKLAFQF